MATTGESYQQARNSLLLLHAGARRAGPETEATRPSVDLTAIGYFGLPLVLASFPIAGRLSVVVLSGAHGRGPFPLNPLWGLRAALAVH